ncbi:MAG: hypothetical protein HQL43_16705, partial [Alphaproteobacteria bacterium]|nr:hypothetical protein [Alphaproteobacteria bacterium]
MAEENTNLTQSQGEDRQVLDDLTVLQDVPPKALEEPELRGENTLEGEQVDDSFGVANVHQGGQATALPEGGPRGSNPPIPTEDVPPPPP